MVSDAGGSARSAAGKDAVGMNEKRESDRLDFVSLGMVDGTSDAFSCRLENISAGGALLRMSDSVPTHLRKGNIVRLQAILLAPVELRCKVTRIDAGRIAVRFLDG
jgi:hypothetical protein